MQPTPSLTENRQLRQLIAARIRSAGPITFAEFMQLALYHPQLGYYATTRPPMGSRGDYVTSPEVSSLFGYTIARHVVDTWRSAGAPASWGIIELGPGSGALAGDLLDALAADPRFTADLRYTLIELSEPLHQQQEFVLRRHTHRLDWLSALDSLPDGLRGHVLSNEFFDALPIHRVTVVGGELKEVYVGLAADGSLEDVVSEPSTPRLAEYFQGLSLLPAERALAEVNLAAVDAMRLVASRLAAGAITTLDYGHDAPDLYAPWRRQGTLLCFYQHSYTDTPYERIGRQDITSHVDFTSIARAAEAAGCTVSASQSQLEFLAALGIEGFLQDADLTLEESLARRRAVQALLDPVGLGRIRVLVATKMVSPK